MVTTKHHFYLNDLNLMTCLHLELQKTAFHFCVFSPDPSLLNKPNQNRAPSGSDHFVRFIVR